jgi:glycosyltransferase involved in cell wall biosynthesis
MRILFIARYRDPTMDRKLRYLAAMEGITVRQLRPAYWRDDLMSAKQGSSKGDLDQISLAMLGKPEDPHRALWRTVSFGLRQFRPDILHAEEEPDSLAALQITLARRVFAPRARLILNTWQNVDRPRRAEVRWVTRQTLRAADGVLCANCEAQSILRRHGYRGYTEVLPAVGVDTDTFRPCPDKPVKRSFVAGYVGRLVPEKGLHTLLEAMARLESVFELRFVGGGREGPDLQAQCRALGLGDRVQFVPPMPPAQVAAYLCELDALVLPSLTTPVWKEQFGRVLTEAMACGVPVVGSDSGAIPEVIGEAGLIFPEGDAAALADCLSRLMGAPALRHELAQRGLARARREYAQTVIATRTAAVYRHLLSEPRHDIAG